MQQSNDEARKTAQQQFDRMLMSDRFMLICLTSEGAEVMLHETTCNFPIVDFRIALDIIRKAMFDKMASVEAPQPLPLADHVAAPDVQEGGHELGS